MKTFSIIDAAVEPFRLAAQRPIATIVWGLVMLAPGLMVLGAMAPLMAGVFSGGFDPVVFDPGADSGAALFGDDMVAMMQFQLWSNLANLLQLLGLVLVTAAIIRAVYAGRRGERAFFLRIGKAELQVAVVGIAVGVGFFFVAMLAVLLAVGLGFAAWQLDNPWRWMLCVLLGVSVGLGLLLLWGRLSLLAPAAIRYGTFGFEEGWKLGKGRSWSLLGLGLVLFLIAIMVGIVCVILFLIVILTVGGGVSATDPEAVEAWFASLPQQPALLAGMAIVLLLPMAWLQGFRRRCSPRPMQMWSSPSRSQTMWLRNSTDTGFDAL